MKAMRLTGLRSMERQETPTPDLAHPGDVRVRMAVVGVCGSDVHYYEEGRIGGQVVRYPFTVGHEGAGIVEAIGAAVTRVKPGDRIALEPAQACGTCDQCLASRPHTCRKLRFLGCPGQAEGCLSEYIVIPEAGCVPIPDDMSFDQAALSEPLAIGVYAVRQSIPMRGARIGILGAGPIGLSVLLTARAQGAARIYVTDLVADRLAHAERAGAAAAGNPEREDVAARVKQAEPGGLDAVFECCGRQEALDQAVDLLKPGGKLMLIGIPPTLERVTFRIDPLRHKELCIQNVRRQNHCVQAALDLMRSGEVPAESLVTHRFPFEKTREAFELVSARADGVLKAMIDMPGATSNSIRRKLGHGEGGL
jgi:L-iditol 2-dehydrogenase